MELQVTNINHRQMVDFTRQFPGSSAPGDGMFGDVSDSREIHVDQLYHMDYMRYGYPYFNPGLNQHSYEYHHLL